jgi:hypothetical protein
MLVAIVTCSCANFSKARLANISQIREGQTPEEVHGVLGKPRQEFKQGSVNLWWYDIYSDDSSKQYPYTAKFENGKLKSFATDYNRSLEDLRLCERRRASNQTLFPLFWGHFANGAPAMRVDSCGSNASVKPDSPLLLEPQRGN